MHSATHFDDLSVVENMILALDSCALVIHAFVPLIIHLSLSAVMVVDAAAFWNQMRRWGRDEGCCGPTE
jgi:hypothetical protein